ncbi:MAG: kinase/pyrophosphorylase [Mycetocola sp.]
MSDSTGVTAETLGNAVLAHIPSIVFQPLKAPFVDTIAGAKNVVADVRAATAAGLAPIVFPTVKSTQRFSEIDASGAVVIDLLGGHLRELEAALGSSALNAPTLRWVKAEQQLS